MQEDKIELWTIHPKGFSITEGCVDHAKSRYYQETPGVKEAYHELWDRLSIESGQVVWCWCCTHENDIPPITGVKKIKWELCVPVSEVLQFIDDIVWNRILGIKCCVRSDMKYKWRKEALAKYPHNSVDSKAYEKQCCENFWKRKPESGSWWNELFVDDPGEAVSALVKHPVPTQWVLSKCNHWLQ